MTAGMAAGVVRIEAEHYLQKMPILTEARSGQSNQWQRSAFHRDKWLITVKRWIVGVVCANILIVPLGQQPFFNEVTRIHVTRGFNYLTVRTRTKARLLLFHVSFHLKYIHFEKPISIFKYN